MLYKSGFLLSVHIQKGGAKVAVVNHIAYAKVTECTILGKVKCSVHDFELHSTVMI